MSKPSDIRCCGARLYFLPVHTRVPLKFGTETLTSVTCARVCLDVCDRSGRRATGWGETPLSVQWVWPSPLPYPQRERALKDFCIQLTHAWAGFKNAGHPLEVGHDFQQQVLPTLLTEHNRRSALLGERASCPPRLEDEPTFEPMPWLAALVCCSPFDIALHDAFGQLLGRPVYELYGREHLTRDLADFLAPAEPSISFRGQYPTDYLVTAPPRSLMAWHLVGGLDPLDASELTGNEPNDGHPVLLTDWIRRDGLSCLKIKLRGNDWDWDFARLKRVGYISGTEGIQYLSADFNCTVREPAYVTTMLDRLRGEEPAIFDAILYVEQPFPYDLEANQIDVHDVSARKPLFMDESAHDWQLVRLGRQLGWNGVALKTCKTQTGALLTACWAKAHSMSLMVQDLTNPMLAQIPHVQLAAQVGTIAGVETNAMQFYPESSALEAVVHPALYRRRQGRVDLATIRGPGFGYRLNEIGRQLPEPSATCG